VLSVVAAAVVLALSIPAFAGEGGGKVDPFYGAYNTEVPIEVPKFHGLEPNLKLTYSSAAGNGFAGVGWSLQGSTIGSSSGGRARYDATDIFLPTAGAGAVHGARRTHCADQATSGSSRTCRPRAWTVTRRTGRSRLAPLRHRPGRSAGAHGRSRIPGNSVSYGCGVIRAPAAPSTVTTTATVTCAGAAGPVRLAAATSDRRTID
jgi:hypothetical protein